MADAHTTTEEAVKEANRRLYDAVAEQYETVDGRRSPRLCRWLRGRMAELREMVPGGDLLDIGSGSGLVTRCAEGIFGYRVGTDISPEILEANRDAFDLAVTADCDNLPFEDASFDVVTCFAVLHHLYASDGLIAEVRRVLRPGGVFYSDHDMDAVFYRRFRSLLVVYRRLHSAAGKYRQASSEITAEMYRLSECHASGIDVRNLRELLARHGFSVTVRFHWFGLAPVTDLLFGGRHRRQGWAPLAAVTAVNEERQGD